MDIATALTKLDPKNDDHWTSDGAPLVGAVSDLVGRPVTRKEIVDAAPQLTRESVAAAGAPDAQKREGDSEGETGLSAGPDDSQPDPENYEAPLPAPIDPIESARAEAAALERESAAITRQIEDLRRQREQIDRRHAAVVQRIDAAETDRDRYDDTIGAYLRNQSRMRAEKAARINDVLPPGLTPAQVAAALDGRSRLDAAMSSRKPGFGAARPQPRPPMQTPARE